MIEDFSKHKWIFLCNAPYSPRYNPIEEVFGILDAKII